MKRLKFGDYVLLQPELLDAYAGAIVNAAREEPDGLGSILESKVVNLDFAVPSTDRVLEGRQERLLVLATLEELLQHELVLREPTEDGIQLVFPSAYRRDLPPSETPKGDGVVFRFEGPVENVYATLIVRLTRSDRFQRMATWQSAARFAADDGECTVVLKYDGEGTAELWIGYDQVPDRLRKQFERFVHVHLNRRATPGSVTRERQYSCPRDGTAFTSEQVQQVIHRGRPRILCPVCEERGLAARRLRAGQRHRPGHRGDGRLGGRRPGDRGRLRGAAGQGGGRGVRRLPLPQLEGQARRPRDRAAAPGARTAPVAGRAPAATRTSPGRSELEDIIAGIPAAAVIVGDQLGPWQRQELGAFMRQSVKRRCVVVPVLLPGAKPQNLPVFLDGLTWVDLNVTEPDPIDQLVWGITGRHENQ